MATRFYTSILTYGASNMPTGALATWGTSQSPDSNNGMGGLHAGSPRGATSQSVGALAVTDPTTIYFASFTSPPLQAQTISSGTVKGQFQCNTTNAANDVQLAFALIITKPDGTARTVWLATTANAETPATEMATTSTNRKLRDASGNVAIPVSSVDVEYGDRITFELGAKAYTTASVSISISLNPSSVAADLPEDDTATTSGIPWIEFSQDIRFAMPWYVRSSAVPTDSASATNATATITLTPPTNMRKGDLVVVFCQSRNSATWTVGVDGGQTWNSLTALDSGNINTRCFWCVFNGTWGASPRFDSTSSTCTSAHMSVFRGRTIDEKWNLWRENTRLSASSTVHSVLNGSNALFLAAGTCNVIVYSIFTDDDNTLTEGGTDLFLSDWDQWRNTSGSDQTLGVGVSQHMVVSVSIDHGSWSLATNGPDPANLYQLTFNCIDDPLLNMPPMQPPSKFLKG